MDDLCLPQKKGQRRLAFWFNNLPLGSLYFGDA